IEASSNIGDIVLDCFVGSGTTLVAAEELERQWIGVDIGDVAIATIIDRLANGSKRLAELTKPQNIQSSLFEDEAFFAEDNDNNVDGSKEDIKYDFYEYSAEEAN
ncbi:MAG: hypothetical protein K2L35_06405, partial [Muribaculaceae bacterium]|nr:hypothetical protein [Muribaculaceae bacterium]